MKRFHSERGEDNRLNGRGARARPRRLLLMPRAIKFKPAGHGPRVPTTRKLGEYLIISNSLLIPFNYLAAVKSLLRNKRGGGFALGEETVRKVGSSERWRSF